MFENIGKAMLIVVPVALSTGLIVALRIEQIAEPEKLVRDGIAEVRRQDATDFAMISLAFGALCAIGYSLAASRWPEAVNAAFMVGGTALTVVLSAAAAILRPQAGLTGVPEVLLMNFIWGVGYGWLLPIVLGHFGSVIQI